MRAIIQILTELQKPRLDGKPGPGAGYNELFQKVRTETHRRSMSAITYDKYLSELERDHVITKSKRDDSKLGRPVEISLNSEEAKYELAFLTALQQIQIISTRRTSPQLLKEYGRRVQTILPNGFVDDDAQRQADLILSKETFTKTSYQILQLVVIAHDCLAKLFNVTGLGDAYIRTSLSGPEYEPIWKAKTPMVDIKSNKVVEANEREASILRDIRTAASNNPTLMRLLKEIVPDLEAVN